MEPRWATWGEQDDARARTWLRLLSSHGGQVPGDHDGPPPDAPPWLDAARLARGQRVAVDNLFSLAYAELVSMLMMFAFEDQLQPLLATGKSHTPAKAYFRYLSTMRRVRSWYEGDLFQRDSEAYKNLKAVRAMHKSVSVRMNHKQGSVHTLHRLQGLAGLPTPAPATAVPPTSRLSTGNATCPFAAAAREEFAALREDPDDGHACWPDDAHPLYLSQRAMAVTQVAFIGLFILDARRFGAHHVTDGQLEDLVYLWRVLGWSLGVHDTHNACLGGLGAARARCGLLVRACALPRLARVSAHWEVMSRALLDGAALAAPGNSLPCALATLAAVLGAPGVAVRRRFGLREKLWLALYHLVLDGHLRSPGATAFYNGLFKLSLWVSVLADRLVHRRK